MATLAPERGRAWLDEAELAVAALLLASPEDAALDGEDARAAVSRLRSAGALRDERLEAWLADLIGPVARPSARAVADVHAGGRLTVVASAWMSALTGTLGTAAPGDTTELAPLDAALLPSALAREVGLGPRPAPEDREDLITSVPEVEEAEAERGEDPLGELMGARRSSWRITVTDGESTRSLAVVDGGHRGYWRVELEDENADRVRLVPTATEDVTERLLALFAR